MSKIFTYPEIEELVIRFKAGDRDAGGTLFEAFKGFIAKYSNFIKFGSVSRKDKDLQGLIRMLCPKGDNVKARLSLIREAIRSYDYEDIVGEMNLLFLEALHHFQARPSKIEGSVPFPGYLYSYFKFKVKRWLDQRLTDVLNTVDLVELTEEEQGMQMLEDTKEFELQFSDARPALDAMTRWILHLYYTKGLKDREIGELVKVSGNWICCQRRDALKKLHALGIENAEDVIRGCGIH